MDEWAFQMKEVILCEILRTKLRSTHALAWDWVESPQSLLPSNPEVSMTFLFVIETLPTKNRKLTFSPSYCIF